MEEAAVHRLAASITQLTLCQVSAEEIDTFFRHQSGQPVAFCKFTELMQWQHHHDDNVHQKELGWIDT